MQPQARPVPASRHYQQIEAASRSGGTGPHSLVALLYEELLRSLDIVIAAAGQKTGVASDIHVARARSILSALENSLDFDNGGTFAPVLARIYRAAAKELAEEVAGGEREKLAEYRAAFSTISYAWTTLAAV